MVKSIGFYADKGRICIPPIVFGVVPFMVRLDNLVA